MRFRKSVKIMKGVRVNFSKSGMSLTAGVRGASINVGSKGAYLNTGIPGTGLYDRKKIGSSTSSKNKFSQPTNENESKVTITISIDDAGNYFIFDNFGDEITDESILRDIKKSSEYKSKIVELSKRFAEEKNSKNYSFIEIYKLSEKIINESEFQNKINNLKPREYKPREFTQKKPDKYAIKTIVEKEAKKTIKSLAFWTLKAKRKEYFDKVFSSKLNEEHKKYELALKNHIENENHIEYKTNLQYFKFFKQEIEELKSFIIGPKKWVEERIDNFLKSMILPVDFEVSYDYDKENKYLKIDLDLPEIEDIPSSKATLLATGRVKVKEKAQKELKEEYLICITGLAFFFATHFFNISSRIEKILISGYTQRLNKKTGMINDDYVYSIIFEREKLKKIKINEITPYLAFENFEHKINYTKTFELSTIEPFENL